MGLLPLLALHCALQLTLNPRSTTLNAFYAAPRRVGCVHSRNVLLLQIDERSFLFFISSFTNMHHRLSAHKHTHTQPICLPHSLKCSTPPLQCSCFYYTFVNPYIVQRILQSSPTLWPLYTHLHKINLPWKMVCTPIKGHPTPMNAAIGKRK